MATIFMHVMHTKALLFLQQSPRSTPRLSSVHEVLLTFIWIEQTENETVDYSDI